MNTGSNYFRDLYPEGSMFYLFVLQYNLSIQLVVLRFSENRVLFYWAKGCLMRGWFSDTTIFMPIGDLDSR